MSIVISDLLYQYPLPTFVLMVLLFAYVGYLIVTTYLMQKQIRSFLPKSVFIITFCCSVSLLAMYLYQICKIHMSEALWDIILSLLVIMSTIIIPILLIFKMPFATYQISIPFTSKTKKLPFLGAVFVIGYIYLLSIKSEKIKQEKNWKENLGLFSKQHINVLIEILVNYGIVIMALMSAYGAVWCPYIYFNRIDSKKQDLERAKMKSKEEIFFIIQQIKKNKYNLLMLKQKRQQIKSEIESENSCRSSQSLIIRGLSAVISKFSDKKKEQSALTEKIEFHKRELDTLYRVHNESFSTYKQIVDQQRKHQISQTLMGKIFWFFSLILSVYSLIRFILTAWNIMKGRKLSTDPITRILNFVLYILNENVNQTFKKLTQYISFGFMGYLMISSVRSFSMNIKNLFDLVLRRRRLNILSTDTLVLLLSQMYGIYFVSAVILLQSSLPRTYVTKLEDIVGTVRLVEHFSFFDLLFFDFCLLSVVFIAFSEWQRKKRLNSIVEQRNFVQVNRSTQNKQ